MIGCKSIREYSSSHQRYAEIRLLIPVLQLGLSLFPTSRRGVAKMNIFETDTGNTESIFKIVMSNRCFVS